jgi:hypothetical protein
MILTKIINRCDEFHNKIKIIPNRYNLLKSINSANLSCKIKNILVFKGCFQ